MVEEQEFLIPKANANESIDDLNIYPAYQGDNSLIITGNESDWNIDTNDCDQCGYFDLIDFIN